MADQIADKAPFAEQGRVVQVDDERVAGPDDQDGVLVFVVDGETAQPRRQLPPPSVGQYFDLKALPSNSVRDLRRVVLW